MFGFKAYFWNNYVYIDGHQYLSNEILNACLNCSVPDLETWLAEMKSLRNQVQLREDADETFCKNYDRHVQRAQECLYKVGGVVKKLPPYEQLGLSAKLDEPLLFDCLNENYFLWEDGSEPDDEDDEQFKDIEYSNEYGFVTMRDNGSYDFYVQHFCPSWEDLASDDADIVLMIRKTNQAVCTLFDSYITFLQDLLLVRHAYAELLDKYIHSKCRFLSDSETAESFTRYLAAEKNEPEALLSSGNMRMSHEVYKDEGGASMLCETYDFDSLGGFLYVDFFRGLRCGYLPKRCDNCGRYFLLTGGKYTSYCDHPLADDPSKTCRDVGARKKYDDKCRTDPVWLVYNRAYKAHYARYMKKKMTVAEFEEWSAWAVEIRTKVENEKIAFEEYAAQIKK